MRVLKGYKGFTLIELLVVVTIITILVLIGIIVYSSVLKSARDSKRKADLDAIAKAFEVKFANGQYQPISPDWFVNTEGGIASVPKDPINSTTSTKCNGGPCFYCYKCIAPTLGVTTCTPGACSENGTDISNVTTGADKFAVCANLEAGGYYCVQNRQS